MRATFVTAILVTASLMGAVALTSGAEQRQRSGKRFDWLERRVKRSAQPEHWDRDTRTSHKPQHRQRS